MKNLSTKGIALAMFLSLFMVGDISAQITYPSLSDNYLATTAGDMNMNNAMINYCPACATSSLFGVTFDDAPGSSSLFLDDEVHSIAIGIMSAYNPDVILGNSGSSTTSFKAGVVYLKGGDVYLNIYDISNPGTGAFSATLNNTYRITTSGGIVNPPHIDVIADAGNTSVNGLPYCDNFIITYVDQISGTGGVYGYYSSLNNPTTSTTKQISTYTAGASDVAAVQHPTSGLPDDVGLFVYDDGSGTAYYREWDVATGSLSSITTVNYTDALSYPRIDGVDDYNNNTSSSTMNWEIIAKDNSNNQVAEYNNLSGTMTVLTSTSTPYTGGISICPGVAAGPIAIGSGNDFFTVSWNTEGTGIAPANFAQTVDRTTGGVSPATYYRVNYNTTNVEFTNQAITNSFNTSTKILISWYRNNDVMYKITDHSMAFKPSSTPINKVSIKGLKIAPNPVVNSIILKSNCIGDQYNITDINGRMVMSGSIQNDNQEINVSSLAKGSYLLVVYSSSEIKQTKFVKD